MQVFQPACTLQLLGVPACLGSCGCASHGQAGQESPGMAVHVAGGQGGEAEFARGFGQIHTGRVKKDMIKDAELKTRTINLKSLLLWPETEKGAKRKPSAEAVKLNRAAWSYCHGALMWCMR